MNMGDDLRRKIVGGRVLALAAGVILLVSCRSERDGVLAAVPAAASGAAQESRAATAKGGGPTIGGCPVFPADNIWNTRVDKMKVDAHSSAYVTKIGADKPLHPDFGSDPSYGIPFNLVRANQKRVKITFDYRDDSDLGNYPIPPNVKIEGGDDKHILLVDTDRCELFEIFAASPQPDGSWKAAAGIEMDLTSNQLRQDGLTSADAAGLPILPGLVRYDEVAAGEIRHALRFTAQQTQRAYVWPARHFASPHTEADFPPMGQRFRLKADVDISKYSKTNQVILTALKHYGMMLSDNGGPWFVTGAPDSRWNSDDLHQLTGIKGSDFEAVDVSDLPYIRNSGRVDPMASR
jgi:hypothetical protein